MRQGFGAARVAGQVLGDRDRIGRPVRLAQPEHRLVHDVLVRAVADAAVDRPGDPGVLADLGDTGGLHVHGAEAAFEDRFPDGVVVEEAVGRHEAALYRAARERVCAVLWTVGVELHARGYLQRTHRQRRIETAGNADDHDVVDRAG